MRRYLAVLFMFLCLAGCVQDEPTYHNECYGSSAGTGDIVCYLVED
jgi:PBP1b-binding outer membrane lipoprotein LpoB